MFAEQARTEGPLAEDAAPQDVAPKKKSKKPVLIGLLLALILGGGGFYATWSGMILGGAGAHASEEVAATALPAIAFVPLDPLVISLGPAGDNRHLRFASQLEVNEANAEEVAKLQPRIIDVLNGYLRAIDVHEFDDPAALVRIRAQLLRRIQIVTGNGRVRDFLVTEFVLN
jgi:flagellar protein FliL